MTSAAGLGAQWFLEMAAGNFEQAWSISDRLHQLGANDPHRLWMGEKLAGKRVMLRCLHGFGDSVQFLRYVPKLRQTAASVCVEVAPRFIHLAPHFTGVEEVITWGERAPALPVEWDVQIEVMELPYVFRTQLAELPLAQNYLSVPPPPSQLADQPAGLPRVGLVWSAGEWNPARSISFNLLQPLFDVPGCEFWNLTTEPAACTESPALRQDAQCRATVAGLAQRIAALDLVVTVDTLAAHLAGAMGVPAWVLLQHQCDWRWMQAREDSPWYPSLRLFRQNSAGGWDCVISRVAEALSKFVAAADRAARVPSTSLSQDVIQHLRGR